MNRLLISLATFLASPSLAHAHVGVDHSHGFLTGFLHPITGLDHMLAMLAAGVFAIILGGRALWMVPLSFVCAMVIGGVLGAAGVELPWVELMIAVSVVVLGAVVAFKWKAPFGVAAALVGVFAFFHGHAHGAEMPVEATGILYAAGFVLATALLHVLGMVLAFAAARLTSLRSVQVAGAACLTAGIGLLGGFI